MKKTGYTITVDGVDCFIESTAKKRTDALAIDFITKIKNKINCTTPITKNEITYFKKYMQYAILELKTITAGNYKGLKYITIDGENFSYGTDACENPLEKIILV